MDTLHLPRYTWDAMLEKVEKKYLKYIVSLVYQVSLVGP